MGKEETVVLSYFHTVSAAAQILNLAKKSVKKFGESSNDLKAKIISQYGSDKWEQVQDKSLANEKSHKIMERQKELQKQQAKIDRITEKLLGPSPVVMPAANVGLDHKANKPKPKPKSADKSPVMAAQVMAT